MADPTSIADIFDVQVQFVPAVAQGRFGFGSPTAIAEFAATPSFPGRIKAYTGTITQKLAALAADGFAVTSDTYRQVQSLNLQDGPARTIYVGRKDAADADWGVGAKAVKDAADADGLNFYAFVASTRDPLEIEAIADYLEGVPDAEVFAFYLAQTDDLNVFNNTPGNVAANILAKNYERTALLWHDPETASGYGPAILESVVGPFNIADGDTIQLQVDGGATQTFTFSAAAATLLGSNTETFAVSDGDQLILSTNGGATQTVTYNTSAATVLSASAETYAFVNGLTLFVRVDGGASQTVTFNGTAGEVATLGGDPFALNDGETVTFAIDGGANQVVTFNAGDFVDINNATAEEINAVYTAQLTGVTVTDDSSNVTVTSNRLGTSSDVEIVAGTGTALATLGYSVGNNNGTGFAAFLDVATAAEVAAEINADTIDCTAADDSGSVRITSDLVGTLSRVQVTGGTANALLNFDTNEYAGTGDFADASAATALEMIAPINAGVTGVIASVSAGAVLLTSTVLGTSSEIDVDASTIATTLGFSLTAANGTGDFANAAQATAAEVSLVISATITGATASSLSSKVVITSATSGTSSTVEAVGGTLLNTLRFVDATTAVSNLATGTGVQEDFCDAAWMGRCITFDLDAANGAALWNNQTLKGPSPTGAGTVELAGDIFDPADAVTIRERLHDTLRVNTYEVRLGRSETHFGTLLNNQLGAGGYIDIRTTIDWLQARIVEEFDAIDNAAADAKKKYPYAASGIAIYDNGLRKILSLAQRNGHTFFDDSPLDLNNPLDTGIFTPSIAEQTQADINNRLIDGFRAQQLVQGGIQRGKVIINLIGPTAEE
jgi:hypothetical protein